MSCLRLLALILIINQLCTDQGITYITLINFDSYLKVQAKMKEKNAKWGEKLEELL